MAYSDPNIPTVDIVEEDPITGLISEANCKGVPPTTTNRFALECQITDLDGTGIYINTGTVALPVWTLQGANIEDDAVTEDKIADDAVTEDKIADDAVTSDKIDDGTIVEEDIADNAITSDKIDDGTIVEEDIADDAVTSDKIDDGAIVAADLAADSVITAKILDANVTLDKLAAGIKPSHIVKFFVSGSTITGSTLEGLAVNDLIVTIDSTGAAYPAVALCGTENTLPGAPAVTDYLIVFRAVS